MHVCDSVRQTREQAFVIGRANACSHLWQFETWRFTCRDFWIYVDRYTDMFWEKCDRLCIETSSLTAIGSPLEEEWMVLANKGRKRLLNKRLLFLWAKPFFSSLFPLKSSGKWTLSQKTSPWPRPCMTRNSCLCRKISKGWVSVQGSRHANNQEGGPTLLGVGRIPPSPCPGTGQPSPTGTREEQSWLPASLSRWRTHPTRAATLGYAQEWDWELCMCTDLPRASRYT